MEGNAIAPSATPSRGERLPLFLPVLTSVLFTAYALLPELQISIPSLNDTAFHFLMVQTASEAVSEGSNIIDHWSSVVPTGFPVLLYYQHLPHLIAAALGVVLFPLSLLEAFNAVRFVLLAGFPITVFFSLRRMDFPPAAASLAAAASPLLSGNHLYGFEYESYIWRGFGMYTQLWAMHLSFITAALLYDVLNHGKSRGLAVIAWSALVLCHAIYAYMMAISALVIFLTGLTRSNARARFLQLAGVGSVALAATVYFWLPFVLGSAYTNASPYLQPEKYDSFGAARIMGWLIDGDILDYNRLPVLTVLAAIGMATALWTRSNTARTAAALFVIWLLLYFGRETWGSAIDILPASESLLMHRFNGSVSMAAIMLVGLAANAFWNGATKLLGSSLAPPLFSLAVVLVLLPAYQERWSFYDDNRAWMEETELALASDTSATPLIRYLEEQGRDRTYAGVPTGWGRQVRIGALSVSDLLAFNQIETIMPPSLTPSINSDLLWHFNDQRHDHYTLFNARNIIAPESVSLPAFARPVLSAGTLRLYEVETGGYFMLAHSPVVLKGLREDFLPAARTWLGSGLPANGVMPEVQLPGMASRSTGAKPVLSLDQIGNVSAAYQGLAPPRGRLLQQASSREEHRVRVVAEEEMMLVLKVTYHPHWHAYVDGERVQTTMVMPSVIGVPLGAGDHSVVLRYEPSQARTWLLFLGVAIVIAAAAYELRNRDRARALETDRQ